MIQVQDWLQRTDTELEQVQKYFQNIVDKKSDSDIANSLHDCYQHIEKDYIPKGQQLRDKWKEKGKSTTTYRDIQIHLKKLRFASLAIAAILSLLG